MIRLKSVIREYLSLIFIPKSYLLSALSSLRYTLVPLLLAICILPISIAGAAQVTLGWDSNSEPDLEGYGVYRNTGSPGPPYGYTNSLAEDDLTDPLHPKVTLTGLQEGKEYYIALTAYNTEGVESSFSNDVCVEVVNGIAEPCSQIASPGASTSSSSGGGGSGGGGSGGCFISTLSHSSLNYQPLFYFLLLPSIMIIRSCVIKK